MRRILIAGAGYVGTRLAELLAERGAEVLAVRRAPGGALRGVTSIAVDLEDRAALARVTGPLDAVVFCAGPSESSADAYRRTYLDAFGSTLEVLGARARRVLFTSSTAVYAQTDGSWVDESAAAEASHFAGAILLQAEALLLEHRPDGVVLRLGGIYGPERASLVEQIRRGEATYTEGDQKYVNRFHRDDCAGALAHLLDLEAPESIYLGVDDEPAPRREVMQWIAHRLAAPPPRPAARGVESPRRGGGHKRCSNARLRASGYVLRYPTFREGYGAVIQEEA